MISLDRSRTVSGLAAQRRQRHLLAQRLRAVIYHAAACIICATMLLPLAWMVSSSLKGNNDIFVYPPHLIPAHPLWSNYLDAMQYIDFWRYFGNTVLIAAFAVAGTLLSCTLTAYSFSRLQWMGRNVLFAVCMATLMLPYQVTMIPLYIIYRHLGWIGSYLPLIVPAYFGNALYIFLLRQFLLTIPRELSEAAGIDGATEVGIFTRIILPLVKPALAAVALFAFLDSWQDFLGPLIYLDNQETFTLSLGLQLYFSQHSRAWAYLMCASVIFTLPAVLIFIFAQKTFIRGITLTGIKG
jgi:multiple sugar transport system permease protein